MRTTRSAGMAVADLLNLFPTAVEGTHFQIVGDRAWPIVAGGDGSDDDGGDDDGQDDDTGSDDGTDDDGQDDADPKDAEIAKWKALARKHENTSKATKAELTKVQKANASDEERKLLEAKEEGRTEVLSSVGAKLVAAEIRAASAGRLDDKARTALVDTIDHTKFLTDDGEVDTDKVADLVEGLAGPKSDKDDKTKTPKLGQGRRKVEDATPTVAAGRDLFEERRKKQQK